MKTENILYLIGAALVLIGALMRILHYSAYGWLIMLGSAAPLIAGIYAYRKRKEKID
tara:strand:+ start:8210 stop:8380 length:171 start_codon:yes stop_codon:yes gene_type:complete